MACGVAAVSRRHRRPDDDRLATLHTVARAARQSVDLDLAGLDPALEPAPRIIGQQGGQGLIQTLPGVCIRDL